MVFYWSAGIHKYNCPRVAHFAHLLIAAAVFTIWLPCYFCTVVPLCSVLSICRWELVNVCAVLSILNLDLVNRPSTMLPNRSGGGGGGGVVGGGGSAAHKRKLLSDPNRPKRPTSAYFFFIQLEREAAARRGEKITRVSCKSMDKFSSLFYV